jgi:hypothetical protein
MIFSFIIIPRFSRVRTMNKNTSVGRSRGQQHQNCSTIRADLASTSQDVRGGGRNKRKQLTSQCLCSEKKHTKQILKQ